MDGSRQLVRRPKRTLGALALGLCAVGLAVGSGADFSAQTANPSNTFSAGSLSMDNSKNGVAIFSPTNMKPGGPAQTGVVDIKNTGSIDGAFTLSRDQLTSSDGGAPNPAPFASKVGLWVVDCGKHSITNTAYGPELVTPTCGDADDNTLYSGTLASQNAALALGTYHPGEQHRYQFGSSLDSSAGNEYAGDGASARYVFDAVQTP
jgi:spore coat-associated protein N